MSDIIELIKLVIGLINLIQQAKTEGWYEDGKLLTARIKSASTDDERRKLLRELVAHNDGA